MKKFSYLFQILVLLTLVAGSSTESFADKGNAVLLYEGLNARAGAPFQPLVEVNGSVKRGSPFFIAIQDSLLRLNDLSYNRVKAGDAYLRFADTAQTRLENEGWEIRSFRGLEGKWNNYIDISGLVAFHADFHGQPVIAVIYHGTAGNKEGWETNFDAQQVDPNALIAEYGKDLYAELLEKLRNASFSPGAVVLKQKLKSIGANAFSIEQMTKFQHQIEDFTEQGHIDAVLSQFLTAPIRLKLEVVNYLAHTGVNIGGKVHRGFAKKYFSSKKDVLALIAHFVSRLPKGEMVNGKLIFSGHSQAGGTANLALGDIAANHAEELFGPGFKNQDNGTFNGYFLSAARVGDKSYARWIHENVGKDYIARQNVDGDPVPVASGDSDMAKLLRDSIPAIGELLAKTANYDDTGHLLLDDGDATWERAKKLYEHEGLDVNDMEALSSGLYSAATMFFGPDALPNFVAPKNDTCSWNPVTKVKSCVNVVGLANKTLSALKGNETAINELSALLYQRYGHLHYGHYNKEIDAAVFDANVVGRDINGMLMQGQKHQDNKQTRKDEAKRLEKQKSQQKLKEQLYPITPPPAGFALIEAN